MEESPYAKFRAFSSAARERGLVLLNRQGKRVFVLHFENGTLTVVAEPANIVGLVRLAANPDLRPSRNFITQLLDLRIERAELEVQSEHYVWRDLFESTTLISLGDWMAEHGFKRKDLATVEAEKRASAPQVDPAAAIKEIRKRLVDYWVLVGSSRIDVIDEDPEEELRPLVEKRVASFDDAGMLRLHALNEEFRDWAEKESEQQAQDLIARGRGSDLPPSAKDLGLERALTYLQRETGLPYEPPDFFGRSKEDDDD